jgi:hypothetical protein
VRTDAKDLKVGDHFHKAFPPGMASSRMVYVAEVVANVTDAKGKLRIHVKAGNTVLSLLPEEPLEVIGEGTDRST